MKDIVVTARINEQTHNRLKSVAEREERTISWLIRKAVAGYLESADSCNKEVRYANGGGQRHE